MWHRRCARAMARNSGLRVFVANGYYDLATPYFAMRYTVNHLDLEGDLSGACAWGITTPGT